MPSSRRGEASRQSRIAWPRPVAAAVIGFGDSRGSCNDSQGSGTTMVSSCSRQRDPAERDAAQERLGVGDGGWPGEDGHGGELARELLQRHVADRAGQHVDEPSQRRVRDRRQRPWGRGVAAVAIGEARMIEHDRDTGDSGIDGRGQRRPDRRARRWGRATARAGRERGRPMRCPPQRRRRGACRHRRAPRSRRPSRRRRGRQRGACGGSEPPGRRRAPERRGPRSSRRAPPPCRGSRARPSAAEPPRARGDRPGARALRRSGWCAARPASRAARARRSRRRPPAGADRSQRPEVAASAARRRS